MEANARSLTRAPLIFPFALCTALLIGILGLSSSAQADMQTADGTSVVARAPHLMEHSLAPYAPLGFGPAFPNSLDVFGVGGRKGLNVRPRLMPSIAPGDDHWLDSFYLNGTNGEVSAFAANGKNVYVVGEFSIAGGVIANRIAKWDGPTWSALGGGVVGNGYRVVKAVAADPYGNVYVGGSFTSIGGVSANHIAKWDGSSWQPMGSGLGNAPSSTSVNAITVDGNGNVYAGGNFGWGDGAWLPGLAKWNGHDWQPLGTTGVDALALDNSGNLYVAGFFPAYSIAKWNGSSWQILGPSWFACQAAPCVTSLAPDAHGNLYASGFFNDSRIGNYIAKWNGSSWSSLGGGTDLPVLALAIDPGGNVYAGGAFSMAGGVNILTIAKWNGSNWQAVGSGMQGGVEALVVDDSGNLYAGGYLFTPPTVGANYIAKWNGSTWSALGIETGVNDYVYALAVDHADSVFVGGQFITAGNSNAASVANWKGNSWSAVDSGMKGPVNALVVDKNGNLYAGGIFTRTGNLIVNRVSKWNGSTWSALGAGVNDVVRALVVDGSDNLYAGGEFTMAGGVAASHVAKWDGANWSALGDGFDGSVNALALDSTGQLYAGGTFTMTGSSTVNGIAKWSGGSWFALGSGVCCTTFWYPRSVNAIAVSGNNVYVGGNFTTAGGSTVNSIAKWNGTIWEPLGSGVTHSSLYSPRVPPPPPTPFVNALAIDEGGELYAGGDFTNAGGATASNIAKWNGSSWQALGSGVSDTVNALALDSKGNVYVGGLFATAGMRVSYYFAKWTSVLYPSYFPLVGR